MLSCGSVLSGRTQTYSQSLSPSVITNISTHRLTVSRVLRPLPLRVELKRPVTLKIVTTLIFIDQRKTGPI